MNTIVLFTFNSFKVILQGQDIFRSLALWNLDSQDLLLILVYSFYFIYL